MIQGLWSLHPPSNYSLLSAFPTLAPDFDSYTKDSFDAKSKETLSNDVIDGGGGGSGDIC